MSLLLYLWSVTTYYNIAWHWCTVGVRWILICEPLCIFSLCLTLMYSRCEMNPHLWATVYLLTVSDTDVQSVWDESSSVSHYVSSHCVWHWCTVGVRWILICEPLYIFSLCLTLMYSRCEMNPHLWATVYLLTVSDTDVQSVWDESSSVSHCVSSHCVWHWCTVGVRWILICEPLCIFSLCLTLMYSWCEMNPHLWATVYLLTVTDTDVQLVWDDSSSVSHCVSSHCVWHWCTVGVRWFLICEPLCIFSLCLTLMYSRCEMNPHLWATVYLLTVSDTDVQLVWDESSSVSHYVSSHCVWHWCTVGVRWILICEPLCIFSLCLTLIYLFIVFRSGFFINLFYLNVFEKICGHHCVVVYRQVCAWHTQCIKIYSVYYLKVSFIQADIAWIIGMVSYQVSDCDQWWI